MSLRYIRNRLATVAKWVDSAAAPDFPRQALDRALAEDSFEALDAGCAAIAAWLVAAPRNGFPVVAFRDAHAMLSVALPEYEDMGDGTVMAVPMGAARTDRPRYHSLGNAALYHGFQISVFDRPLVAEPLFDAAQALYAGRKIPVGFCASYRVAILDGALQHPPLHPSQITR